MKLKVERGIPEGEEMKQQQHSEDLASASSGASPERHTASVGRTNGDVMTKEQMQESINELRKALTEYVERHEAACDPTGLPEYEQACDALAKLKLREHLYPVAA